MKEQKLIKIRVRDAKAFAQWQRLSAAINAATVKREELSAKAGLPKSKQFKRDCKGYLVNGNGVPIGKFSVFTKAEFIMPACKVCRIS